MNNIIRIINSIEESGLLTKAIRKIIKNQAKEQKDGFSSMLITALDASSLEILLTSKSTIRADQDFNPASSFNKFWKTKVLSRRPKFNSVYSRKN